MMQLGTNRCKWANDVVLPAEEQIHARCSRDLQLASNQQLPLARETETRSQYILSCTARCHTFICLARMTAAQPRTAGVMAHVYVQHAINPHLPIPLITALCTVSVRHTSVQMFANLENTYSQLRDARDVGITLLRLRCLQHIHFARKHLTSTGIVAQPSGLAAD